MLALYLENANTFISIVIVKDTSVYLQLAMIKISLVVLAITQATEIIARMTHKMCWAHC